MIDDTYDVWLIEVNSSPSMEYSTVIIIEFFIYIIYQNLNFFS